MTDSTDRIPPNSTCTIICVECEQSVVDKWVHFFTPLTPGTPYEVVCNDCAKGYWAKRLKQQLSERARAERRPPSPEELIGALQDRVHRDIGKSRVPKLGKRKPTNKRKSKRRRQ